MGAKGGGEDTGIPSRMVRFDPRTRAWTGCPAGAITPGVVRSRLWLLPLLLAVMVAGGWWFGFRADRGSPELPVYVTGGERMSLGEAIYQPATDKKPFSYPPFSALVFVPFAAIPAQWQPAVWFEKIGRAHV